MRVEAITLRRLQMRLKAPFETSFGSTHERSVLLIELQADGLTGWSEITAMEAPTFNPETVGTSAVIVRHVLVPAVLGKVFGSASEIPAAFAHVRGHEMARAGIENALWDVEAQQANKPLSKLLGGAKNEIPCGVSIGLQSSPEVLREKVAVEVAAGYQRIKLKIKPGKDLHYVSAIRKTFPDVTLSVDANSAYTLTDQEHLKRFDEFRLLMMEQPLWWDDIYAHSKLQKALQTSICLDESIQHVRDAATAVELGATRIINVKLGRVGGHSSARDIQAYCLAKNIPVWCGGMLESGVGRAHNIAVSSLPGYTLPGDVSASKRYWVEDIIEPVVEVSPQGTIRIPDRPGLGYHVRRELIERWTIEKETWRAR
ncbi:MAG: o-succinylbenzoate synthase [Acidobacteria bacterium]|nr:o-succinylbenzoate synthase [Acidobacteriota bacterium]MBS1866664.1 o-succinylbenzoate synthase [Acidobacteriota bacterium]